MTNLTPSNNWIILIFPAKVKKLGGKFLNFQRQMLFKRPWGDQSRDSNHTKVCANPIDFSLIFPPPRSIPSPEVWSPHFAYSFVFDNQHFLSSMMLILDYTYWLRLTTKFQVNLFQFIFSNRCPKFWHLWLWVRIQISASNMHSSNPLFVLCWGFNCNFFAAKCLSWIV